MPALGLADRAELAAGLGRYLADVALEDALEVAFVRSTLPHAAIGPVLVPGGFGLSGRDLETELAPLRIEGPGLTACPWHALPVRRARYVGEPLAMVWAADRYLAEDLADQVVVDYQPLGLEVPVHEEAPDGVLFEERFDSGGLESAFERADRVVEGWFAAARQSALPIECRGVIAAWAAGRLTLWTSTQVPDLVRGAVAAALRLREDQVRVLVPHVGGGFGLKAHVLAEEIALAAAARRLGRTLRWVEDRRENLIASAHAHDTTVTMRAAVAADGRVLAVDAEVSADVGAYSIFPFSASLEPMTCASTLFGVYAIEALRFHAVGRASNRCPLGAHRGVGMNAAVHATERMMDRVASELGIDPLELRRRNAIRRLPAPTPAGRDLDSGDHLALLARLRARAGYDALRREQAEARSAGRLLGIGIALFNEHSGTGGAHYRRRGITTISGLDACRVVVTNAGRVEIRTSAADAGQGHAETYRAVAARELGIASDRVDVVEGDTDLCPAGTGTFASRGAVGVLESVVRALRAAAELDLAPGTDVTRTVDPEQVYPSGAHLAVVEVDRVTLVARVLRYVAVEDCGTVIEHQVVEGQVRGGVANGIGGVLLEEHVYDQDGQILTASLLDYLVPLTTDVPAVEMEHLELPTPRTTLGSKGVGEAGTIGAFGAVANAVADAVAPLGAELKQLPYSPAAIFKALQIASPLGDQ